MSCNLFICVQCIVSSHNAHQTFAIVDSYFNNYSKLESSMNRIGQMVPAIKHSLVDIDNQMEKVNEQNKTVKAKIRLMVEALTNTLQGN